MWLGTVYMLIIKLQKFSSYSEVISPEIDDILFCCETGKRS